MDRAERKASRAQSPAQTSATESPPAMAAVAAESPPADSDPSKWFTADRNSRKPIPGPRPLRWKSHSSQIRFTPMKLEGEVLLEVMFNANGTLHVNRVVRGLGHGLDEAAIAAANKMRFKPALRMGQPTDSTAVVHVMFQMAY